MPQSLQVVIIKPSKYMADGFVERFRRGFMPNSTVPYMRSMVPAEVDGMPVGKRTIDEYVHTDLKYLKLLSRPEGNRTLVALVGVQRRAKTAQACALCAISLALNLIATQDCPPLNVMCGILSLFGTVCAIAACGEAYDEITSSRPTMCRRNRCGLGKKLAARLEDEPQRLQTDMRSG